MATKNIQAAKPSKKSDTKTSPKKAISAPKAVAGKNNAKSAKEISKKAVASKPKAKVAPVAPSKKSKVVAKPTPKSTTPAKKSIPAPKSAKTASNAKTINNKKVAEKNKTQNIKKVVAPKKVEVTKKAAPAKKALPVKKVLPKKAEPVVAKKVASKPVKVEKAAPVTKKAVAKPEPKPVKEAPKAEKIEKKPVVVAKKVITKSVQKTVVSSKPVALSQRPTATPAARTAEKKPTVIIAHRKLESKLKAPTGHANTMVSYQPETYRSILDEPEQPQGPVFRYSDEDLNEFRDLINSRLDAARKELNFLQGLITRKDEAGTEDTENRFMNMEDGSGAMEREQLAQLASRQIQFMGHLEKALVRVENKTYGICRVTGKLIDKARLRAVPHATLSIEAKRLMSTKQN